MKAVQGMYRPFQWILQNLRTIIAEVVRKSTEGVDISEAKVVVAGGRGVKSAEGFEPLQELATLT